MFIDYSIYEYQCNRAKKAEALITELESVISGVSTCVSDEQEDVLESLSAALDSIAQWRKQDV